MTRVFVLCAAAALLLAPSAVRAQERLGAGRIEIDSALLGGGFVTLSSGPQPRGYVLNVAMAANARRRVGFEGDFSWAMRRNETVGLSANGATQSETPNMLFYSGNVVFNPFGHERPVVPYVEVGGGALSVLTAPVTFGIVTNSTHLTATVGGGVRWFIINHWGARADYRYIRIGSANAPAGVTAIRYANRLYGGLTLTF